MNPQIARALFEAPLVRGLSARDRDAVLGSARVAKIGAGETIYGAEASADSIFVVVRGAVRLLARKRGEDTPSVIRVARAGDSFGEEALLFGGVRQFTASAEHDSEVVELEAAMLERAIGRSGTGAALGREQRFAERSAIRDLLRTAAFAGDLPDGDFEMLLDSARRISVARGERVFSRGDPARALFVIASGIVQLQRETDGRPEVRAYLSRGDFFGDEEIFAREPRNLDALAQGPSELIEVPAELVRTLGDRNPKLLSRVRRIRTEQSAASAIDLRSTQHVLRDAYRMQMARSLLVIDQDACVRCGHCAWTCESLHGVSRLTRRGDKVVTALPVIGAGPQSLMLPSSCQHCKNPLCMIDCPTGAIGRDPEGEVFIREELCTGCGNCAKACPWDNIQMAPSKPGAKFPDVAVKCDLCHARGAPACVEACPTESIFRLEPQQDIAEVAALFGRAPGEAPRRRSRTGTIAASVSGVAIGAGLVGAVLSHREVIAASQGIGLLAGVIALIALVALALYSVPKRLVRLFARGRSVSRSHEVKSARSRIKPLYHAHLAIGLAGTAAVLWHAGPRVAADANGALAIAFWLVAGLGAIGAVLYRFVPSRVSRLERQGKLPEDLAAERERLFDRLHTTASGKSDLIKSLLGRVLVPYARAPLGWIALVLSGRSEREERDRLERHVHALLEGRGKDKLAGLDALIAIVVELRSLPARRWLERSLRMWLVPHIVLSAILFALLAIHLYAVLR